MTRWRPLGVVLLMLAAGRAAALADTAPDIAAVNQQMMQLYSQGHFQEALPLARQVLAFFEAGPGPDSLEVAASLNNLAELLVRLHNFAEAEPLYRRSLSIRQRKLPAGHPDIARSEARLAELARLQSQAAAAPPTPPNSGARPPSNRTLPPPSPEQAAILAANHDTQRANALNGEALKLSEQGKFAEAIPLAREELTLLEKALPADHPSLAVVRSNLAQFYAQAGDYAAAEPLLQQSMAQLSKQQGAEAPGLAQEKLALAEVDLRLGRYGDAEPLLKQALPVLEKAFGHEHDQVKRALRDLAELYRGQGRDGQANAFVKDRLALQKVAGDRVLPTPDAADLAEAHRLEEQIFRLSSQGQNGEALPPALTLQTLVEKMYGADSLAAALNLDSIAGLYRKLGRTRDAQQTALKSQVIRDEARAADPTAAASK